MEKVEQGIIGIITNHSFLDNPTFRGMRQSLMTTFDQLYFIDLHGNAKKKEKTPDGEKDENVFDIEQGVTISILIKKKGIEKKIYHNDFWGTRSQKYQMCLENSFENIDFSELNPVSPYYFFVPKSDKFKEEYEKGIPIEHIFHLQSQGILTSRDTLAININKTDLATAIKDFINLSISDKEIETKYKFSSNYQWKISEQRKIVAEKGFNENLIKSISYRPFDNRYIYFDPNIVFRMRNEVMQHLIDNSKNNIALNLCKIGRDINSNNYFVSNLITDKGILSSLDNANVFPLYIYEKQNLYNNIEPINKAQSKQEKDFLEHQKAFEIAENEFTKHKKIFEKIKKPSDQEISIFEEHRMGFEETRTMFDKIKENYENELLILKKIQEQNKKEHIKILENGLIKRPNFTTDFSKFIKNTYDNQFTPEQILGYIYAILHSDTYRKKYAEFLKIDYPKILFTNDIQLFKKMSKLGEELIKKHLLIEIPQGKEYENLGDFKGNGDNLVIKPEFKVIKTDEGIRQILFVNKTQYFETIPENVYYFFIGGYQVLEKYLKDRKNKILSLDEMDNVANSAKIITFTIKQMELIEKETKEWI